MSLDSYHRMTMNGDTSNGRCEGHDMSPRSDCPMTTGEDTFKEGVRDMKPHDDERRHLRWKV